MAEPILDDESIATRTSDTSQSDTPQTVSKVKGTDLRNLLNYVNFREGTIFVTFRHRKLRNKLSFQAMPLPSLEDTLNCRWLAPGLSASFLSDYVFEDFHISDGESHVSVKAELSAIDRQKVAFKIPEFGFQKAARKIQRHTCFEIDVQVIQNGIRFQGTLVDFNAVGFRIELSPASGSFHWLNPQFTVTVLLEKAGQLVFSGECLITRSQFAGDHGTCVLAPNFSNIQRYRRREFRSLRQVLSPAPTISFHHPLVGKLVFLPVTNLSGSGFAVEEFFESSLLFPGLIIDEVHLSLGNQPLLSTRCQVLYRNVFSFEQGRSLVQCGVVFLDMEIQDQARLAALLHQTTNRSLQVNSPTDMEELWRFFFESGFFYPSKYAMVEANKADFKKTYETIYLRSPAFARHFTFRDKGVLFAHMSMIRVYPEAWLIHHHAASKSGYGLAGVAVLDQIGRYMNEFHNHQATHASFVMCYFRRENKFPSRVFGGAATDAADPKANSLDTFAYFSLTPEMSEAQAPVQLFPATPGDLADLTDFYEQTSGGLMLDAMNLKVPRIGDDELNERYRETGLFRQHHAFALKNNGSLQAILTVTLSNLGLNLSNLTNCIHVFVIDGVHLEPETLFAGLANLTGHFGQEDLPVLLYPTEYAQERGIAYDKEYILWVLDLDHLDGYFQSIQRRFKRGSHGES